MGRKLQQRWGRLSQQFRRKIMLLCKPTEESMSGDRGHLIQKQPLDLALWKSVLTLT